MQRAQTRTPSPSVFTLLLVVLGLPAAGCLNAGDAPETAADDPMAPSAPEIRPTPIAPAQVDAADADADCHTPPDTAAPLCWASASQLAAAATLAIAGDFDGDAAIEALIATSDRQLHWLRVDGDGAPALAAIADVSLSEVATAGVVGEIDGDPGLEIALITGATTTAIDPQAGGTCEASPVPLDAAPLAVTAGDLDGDGRATPVIAFAGSGGVASFAAVVDGPLLIASAPTTLATGIVAIGDLDGDHFAEAVTPSGPGALAIYSHTIVESTMVLADTITSLAAGEIDGLLVADLDLDGDDDLIVHQRAATCEPAACEDLISVFLGAPTGLSSERQTLQIGRDTGAPIVTDIDGDGAPDLVWSHAEDPSLGVLLGDGLGFFRDRFAIAGAPEVTGARLSAGDLDGDGRGDLLLIDRAAPGLWLILSGG